MWRYQPVYTVEGADKIYELCECYFDDEHKLTQWTRHGNVSVWR